MVAHNGETRLHLFRRRPIPHEPRLLAGAILPALSETPDADGGQVAIVVHQHVGMRHHAVTLDHHGQ